MPHTPHHPRTRGFSLIELLTVIAIASVIIGLSLPSVRGLLLQGQVASNSTALSAAADTARRLAKSRAVQVGYPEDVRYEGVAMVVTPSGEIRMTIHEPTAKEFTIAPAGVSFLGSGSPANRWSGFRDIEDLPNVPLTKGADIYGIDYVQSAGGGVGSKLFLPPPFAIRFDPEGRLVVSSITSWDTSSPHTDGVTGTPDGVLTQMPHAETKDRLVVYRQYDNGSEAYDTGATRDQVPASGGAAFPAGLFDPRSPNFDPLTWVPTWSQTDERFDLPFGVLECVGAVRIVQAGEDPDDPVSGYTDLIFSRYSGSPTRIQSLR